MSVLRLEIPSFVIVSLFVFSYIGLLPLYFGWDEYRYNTGVQDKFLVLEVFLYSALAILTFYLGALLAKYVLRGHPVVISENLRGLRSIETVCLSLSLVFVFAILMLYISKVPSLAILVAFSDGHKEAAVARSLMGNDFSSKYHWYSVVMHDMAKVITFTLFAAWLVNKKKVLLFLFLVAFSLSAFSAVMSTEKAPLAWLLIGLFLTLVVVKYLSVIPLKKIAMLLFSVIALLVLSYVVFTGSSSAWGALLSVFSRAFTGSIQPAYHYLEFFPEHHDFLFGRSLPNPGGIFLFEPYRLTVEVMNWRFPNHVGSGIVGSMPTVFWAEAYANFGTIGVISLPIFAGAVVYTGSHFFNKLENTPIKVGLFVWLLLHYKNLANSGFSGFIVDFYLFVVVFFVLSILVFSNKLRLKLR